MDRLLGILTITDVDRARAFYVDVLGLTYVREDWLALVLQSGANTIRLVKVANVFAQSATVMGWETEDIHMRVKQLTGRGVTFLQYAWFDQDELGVWVSPTNDKVAWFTDPDGNVLSIAQHAS